MRVLLTGTYCSKNKGDATMQGVFAAELLRRRPHAQVVIGSPFAAIDIGHYAEARVVKSSRRNLPLATLHWLVLIMLRLLGRRISRYPLDAEIDAMTHADAVVDLSGDMLTEDYGPLVGYSHFLPLLQAQATETPVIICAQSIGPFRWLLPLARRILSGAALVTVRESITFRQVEALCKPAITPVLTADLAFLLSPAPAERIDAILVAEGIALADRPRLGVSVSALLLNRTNPHLGANSIDTLASFADALDAVTERLGVEVVLIPHVFGPKPASDDRTVAERLAGRMRHPPLCLRDEYRPEEIKGVIARCDAFVGCRMHANIAALESGVPVFAIGYSHKTRGILADLGLEEWLMPVGAVDAQKLSAGIERLFAEAPRYRRHLESQLALIKQRAAANFDLAVEIIDRIVIGGSGE